MTAKLAFAADFASLGEARNFIGPLEAHLDVVKIGLELFMSAGPSALTCTTRPVMLDLKLYDIPETVERAVKRAGDMGVKYLTLHCQQMATMQRAAKAAEPYGIQLLGVTVLTSMKESDLRTVGVPGLMDPTVVNRAAQIWAAGITGMVASTREIPILKKAIPQAFLAVPGIRLPSNSLHDQDRVGWPGDATRFGADLLVVGRSIRDAHDPLGAVKRIRRDIEKGFTDANEYSR